MSTLIRSLTLVIALTPCLAFAAVPKKTVRTTTTTVTTEAPATAAPAPAPAPTVAAGNDQTLFSNSTNGSSIPAVLHNHLSLTANYDFADSYEVSGGQKYDSDRALNLGAIYEFSQFSPGLGAQIGGTYDFSRELKNTGGLKIQEWTGFAELTAHLTPAFKFMGGLNYNFPSMTGAADGASIKGKVGYQIGASFQFAQNIAIDGRYRSLEMDVTGAGRTNGLKSQGFVLGGRFIF